MAKLITMGSFRLEFPEGTQYTVELSKQMMHVVFDALDKEFPEALIQVTTDYEPPGTKRRFLYETAGEMFHQFRPTTDNEQICRDCGCHKGNHPYLNTEDK